MDVDARMAVAETKIDRLEESTEKLILSVNALNTTLQAFINQGIGARLTLLFICSASAGLGALVTWLSGHVKW